MSAYTWNRKINWRMIALSAFTILHVFVFADTVSSAEITGITEAFKKVDVASPEPGLIQKSNVKPGQKVKAGDVLVQLDFSLQQAQLELSRFQAKTVGEIKRARAEVEIRQSILDHLLQLRKDGFAQNKELLRAEMDLKVAKSTLLSRNEKHIEDLNKLKISEINLARRQIVSPIDGIVADVQHEEGEFVSQINPEVVTLVQLDPILARFQVGISDIDRFSLHDSVTVTLESGQELTGSVDSIGVIAESETVTVKIKLPNKNEQIRSGQQCHLKLPHVRQLSQK